MEIFLPVYDIEWLLLSRSWFNSVSSVQLLSLSDSLRPHELQHARLPCPSLTPGVYPNLCPLSQWCHPTISASIISLFSCSQYFPASGSFPMSQLFASCGRSTGVSASASVLPMNIQDGSPLGDVFSYIFLDWGDILPCDLSFLMDPQSHLFSFSTTFFVVVRMAAVLSSSWIRAEAIISHLFSSPPSFFLPLPLSFLSSSLPSSNILALFTFSLLWQPQSRSLFLWVCF